MAKKIPTPSADEASPNASGKAAPSPAKSAEPWHIGLKTDEELKQLARDLVAGQVFYDGLIRARHPHNIEAALHDMHLVFMPLAFAGPAVIAGLAEDGGLLYEYLAKAGPRGINDYPMFFSFQVVHRAQLEQLQGYITKIQAALADL